VCQAVDLVMVSIKHPLSPRKVSNVNEADLAANLKILAGLSIPVWLRYVLIPGLTDAPEALTALGKLACSLPSLKKIQILPFNHLAEEKWRVLGKQNPLFCGTASVPVVTEAQIRKAEETVKSVCPEKDN
jgi:pyruvate formate lyase activating enzyme